jgi:hypothetical protein
MPTIYAQLRPEVHDAVEWTRAIEDPDEWFFWWRAASEMISLWSLEL